MIKDPNEPERMTIVMVLKFGLDLGIRHELCIFLTSPHLDDRTTAVQYVR
jgi:hypothetical protein